MTRPPKRVEQLEGQMDFFGETVVSEDKPETNEIPTVTFPGAITLYDYYSGLENTLSQFGSLNKGENFRNGIEFGYKRVMSEIARKGQTPRQAKKESLDAAERVDGLARKSFARSFGFTALKETGMQVEARIKMNARSTYKEFKGKYQGLTPEKKAARKIYLEKVKARRKKFEPSSNA